MDRDVIRPPLWVRFQLLGIPDRTTAIVVWWLLLIASIGVPIYCLKTGHVRVNLQLPVAVSLGLLCCFSNICTGTAVRWMDRHAAWDGR